MANTNTSEKKQDRKEKKLMTGTNTVSGSGSPTAGGGVKSRDDYYNDVYGKAKTAVDEQHASRLATDTDTKTRINEAIDKAAEASTGRYQTQIDNAPRESRVQFDQNAVRDAVAKKQVQERLANMGVTDSGLNSSMQTAMAIQKQRADNTVRSEERAKIQAAQDAINQIMAESDSKKAEQGIAIDRATADWYNQVMAQLPTQAYGLANDSYSFDKTMENEEINRNWNAEQAKLNRDFQASEADKNRTFTTDERVASQNWQAGQDQIARDWQSGENKAARDWQAGQDQIARDWQSGENKSARDWQAGQDQIARDWQSGENKSARDWQAGQDQIARDWQSGENKSARDWQARENQTDREYDSYYNRVKAEMDAAEKSTKAAAALRNGGIASADYFETKAQGDGTYIIDGNVFNNYQEYATYKLRKAYGDGTGDLSAEDLVVLMKEYGITK